MLPALVLTLEKTLAKEQEFIQPKIDIIEQSDEVIDNSREEECSLDRLRTFCNDYQQQNQLYLQ